MSNVQEVRHRLLCEQFEQWVEKISNDELAEAEVIKEHYSKVGLT